MASPGGSNLGGYLSGPGSFILGAIFSAALPGQILVAAIPSGERWYAPTIVPPAQTILVAAIPSGETWYSPQIAPAVIDVSPIPSGEAWYSPHVQGPTLFINVRGIPSGERWPTPVVTGGSGGLQVFLGGIDYTQYVSLANTAGQITSQTLGRWQFTFELSDPAGQFYLNSIASPAISPPPPVPGMTVLVIDNGLRVFAGCVQQVVNDRVIAQPYAALYELTCTDKSAICDHRVVTGTTYPSGADVAQTILAIVASYLNGEGIGTGGVPTDGSLGTLPSDLVLNFVTVTNAFDQVATISGTVWWIDSYCVLHFSPLNHLPAAPFSITETSLNYRASQTGQTNVRGGRMTVTQTTVDYYNKLYAISNLNITPGSSPATTAVGAGNTETYDWAPGQPGIVPDYPGAPLSLSLLQVSAGIGSVISMTVNGNPQTVIEYSSYTGQTRTGPTDYFWFYQQGTTLLAPTYGASIPANAVIVIEYVPGSGATAASAAQYGDALAPIAPSGQPFGTCGSGLFEGVIQAPNISSQADLNAVAAAELARIGGIPTVVDFQTDVGGLAPGQLLTVNVPISGIPTKNLLVTSMTGYLMPKALATGYRFRWDVKATSILDPGNWITWYERLVGRTAAPLPVLQQQSCTFVLGAGGYIDVGTPGVPITNPYIVSRTGLVTQVLFAAASPPMNQNLVMTVYNNGNPILSVIIPGDGSVLSNQLVTMNIPASAALYVYAQDILTVQVTYQITGASPLAASGVTLRINWSM